MSKLVIVIAVSLALMVHTDVFAQDRLPNSTSPQDEINKLKAVVADQQKRIEQLEQTVGEQKKLIEQALRGSASTHADSAKQSVESVKSVDRNASADEPSPLSIRIGKVSVTPYGFLDLTTIVRDKDVASGISTNFGSIPFSNTVTGQLSELRFTITAGSWAGCTVFAISSVAWFGCSCKRRWSTYGLREDL